MARKKVIDLDASTTVGFGKDDGQIGEGQEISGYYLGSRKVKTSMGISTLHVLQTDAGNLGVWGSAQLDAKLGTIPLGATAFITYKGKVKVPKGTMKKFDVEYDDKLSIHVDSPQVNFNAGQEPEEEAGEADAEETESEETEEEAEEEVEQKPAPRSAAPKAKTAAAASSAPKAAISPERKAQLAALIGGAKKA